MKATFALFLGLGLCLQAQGLILFTTDNHSYENVTTVRPDPDGLYIEYNLPGGGMGMAKIKYTRLTEELQKKYGYDPDKAREFETKVAKATEDWRQEAIRQEQAAQERIKAREAREDEQEKVANERILAMAQLKQAEAELARATGGYYSSGGGYSGWGGYGVIALPDIGNAFPTAFAGAPFGTSQFAVGVPQIRTDTFFPNNNFGFNNFGFGFGSSFGNHFFQPNGNFFSTFSPFARITPARIPASQPLRIAP